MGRCSAFLAGLLVALLFILDACGDSSGGGGEPEGDAAIRTLAYVVTQCHEDATSFSLGQALQIQRGDRAPVTVAAIPTLEHLPAFGLCQIFASFRIGTNSVFAGALQRLGTAPDGSGVVFEVNFEFSLLARMGVPNPLTPDQEGIFYVRADGTGLRRLGPASQEPAQGFIDFTNVYDIPFFAFSPNGTAIAFTDRGPGPVGEDAAQVVLLDIATGTRKPLTRLPDAPPEPSNLALPVTFPPFFLDDESLEFGSRANPDDLNPDGTVRFFTVKTDGTGLSVLPVPGAFPGSEVVPTFSITRTIRSGNLVTLDMPGTPLNPVSDHPEWGITEVFAVGNDHILQLTNFARIDTGQFNAATDGRRVFFTASADPLGTNPSNNCQFFSMDSLGADLRQLTQFGTGEPSTIGCLPLSQPPAVGCYSYSGPVLDPETRTLVFSSTCDPLGTNPNGEQLFAMRLDGTGLRQLTQTRGVTFAVDGSIDVELPGPGAYSVPGGSLF